MRKIPHCKQQPCRWHQVNCIFKADWLNKWCDSDFTYVQTWKWFLCLAFVSDEFPRDIAAMNVIMMVHPEFVLETLDPTLLARRRHKDKLVRCGDDGSQYLSI